jgi:hypothetical protein
MAAGRFPQPWLQECRMGMHMLRQQSPAYGGGEDEPNAPPPTVTSSLREARTVVANTAAEVAGGA